MTDIFDNKILINNTNFDIEKTFDCGQCFRFDKTERGYEGVAKGKYLRLCQTDGGIEIIGVDKDTFQNEFIDFFDLERNYGEIDRLLSQDAVLKKVIPFSKGIRILRQEPFETLVSFIISSTNNIPRIKKIITSLCESFGEKIIFENKTYYAFPTAKKLAELSLCDLAVIKAGFRDKYILDCARKVDSGEIDLDKIYEMDYEAAAKELMKIKGVGRKVADCALLFGFGFIDSFPKDVWIKRVLQIMYNTDSEKELDFYGYGGIAQQYLFYYARENHITEKD